MPSEKTMLQQMEAPNGSNSVPSVKHLSFKVVQK